MELHRYDIVEAEITMTSPSGSVQKKKRPYVLVGNDKGTMTAPIVIAMPLTSVIKKRNLPTHGCIEANNNNGLKRYSMVLGEQPYTLDKETVIVRTIGSITDPRQRDMVNRVCWNTLFFGEDINWKELVG